MHTLPSLRFGNRIAIIKERRTQALQFCLATILLSLIINLLSSILFQLVDIRVGFAIIAVSFLFLVPLILTGLWSGIDSSQTHALLFLVTRLPNGDLKRLLALVPGIGYGISADVSKDLLRKGQPPSRQFLGRWALEVAETVVWAVLSDIFREGWYLPGPTIDNINVSWVEPTKPKSGTEEVDLTTSLPTEHVARHSSHIRKLLVPKNTRLRLERDVSKSQSRLILENKYVIVSINLEWNFEAPDVKHSVVSPWVPQDGQGALVYLVQVAIRYKWRNKVPYSRKADELATWAERLSDRLLDELSFRAFEREEEISWKRQEVEAVERLLGKSRWE